MLNRASQLPCHLHNSVQKPESVPNPKRRSALVCRNSYSELLIEKLNELFDFHHLLDNHVQQDVPKRPDAARDYLHSAQPKTDLESSSILFAPLDVFESGTSESDRIDHKNAPQCSFSFNVQTLGSYEPLYPNCDHHLFLHDLIYGDIYDDDDEW
ncbi:LAME_0E06238g1_1 [Lachancea meyersii CBS 8951]|uniref:LAME_0E06238g1_1 n=1 Tax=Lachancea meyersii CBS 8951 TaxID=1266667 RepID=A0A1G4JI38_9SACH|nr:LAME_0E06238g1_1 [Lachancea meyersii CBS 8951]